MDAPWPVPKYEFSTSVWFAWKATSSSPVVKLTSWTYAYAPWTSYASALWETTGASVDGGAKMLTWLSSTKAALSSRQWLGGLRNVTPCTSSRVARSLPTMWGRKSPLWGHHAAPPPSIKPSVPVIATSVMPLVMTMTSLPLALAV